MSNSSGRPTVSGNVLVLAIAAMFVAVVAAVVILAIGLPESQNPAALVGQLLGSFATLTVALGALFKISKVEQAVADVAEDATITREQTNGGLHRAVRDISYESVTRALADRLDDPK